MTAGLNRRLPWPPTPQSVPVRCRGVVWERTMSNPDEKKPPQSKTVLICTIVFLAVGIGVFQAVTPTLFPRPPGGGINLERTLWAGIVGAACAVIGAGIG